MGVLTSIFNTLIVLLSLFMICLVLIQRGKGGGLAGAFGGSGGSSAFGTKAGDTFTRITIVTASIWILMTMLLVILTGNQQGSSIFDDAPTSLTRDLTPKADVPPVPTPVGGGAATSTVPVAPSPAPAENVPAIPPTSNFPLTPGNEPPPIPK